MRILRVFTLSFALAFAMSVPAHAEDKSKAQQKDPYVEAIRRALEEYALGHWTEAFSFFSNAHALNPSARTLRGMALASYEMRSYADAIGYFERALADPNQALEGRLRDEAVHFLAESQMFVTKVTLSLVPEDAKLKIDNRPIQLPADRTLTLDPGTHTFSAEAEGYETGSQNVVTRGGESVNVTLQLRTTSSALANSAPFVTEQQPRAAAEPKPQLGPWIVIGASGAVAIAGGVFLGVAAANKSSAEDPGANASYQDVQDAAARGRTFFPLGFALVGVGAAGVAAGLAWKYWPIFGNSEHNTTVLLMPASVSVRTRF
jgi:tetratricopeptide (TPR) repeat protein